jgi:hypothetical protein
VVVVALVDGVTTEPLPMEPLLPPAEPGPPMELVEPELSLLLLVEPGVLLPLPMELVLPEPLLPGVPLVLLDVDVSGSGLVHAPSETAAMSASAAHDMSDDFIRKLLEGCSKVATGSQDCPKGTLGSPCARIVGSRRRCM